MRVRGGGVVFLDVLTDWCETSGVVTGRGDAAVESMVLSASLSLPELEMPLEDVSSSSNAGISELIGKFDVFLSSLLGFDCSPCGVVFFSTLDLGLRICGRPSNTLPFSPTQPTSSTNAATPLPPAVF